MIGEHIENRAIYLMQRLRPFLAEGPLTMFYIAGGALVGQPNDVDIFPCPYSAAPVFLAPVVSKTKNAITYDTEPWPVQVCSYTADTTRELVESFDYTHIQVGAKIRATSKVCSVLDVAYTPGFILAAVSGQTKFTGSEFPLSSLLRAGKYYKRELMTSRQYTANILTAVTAVIKRGFANWEDFKNQIDAIDLGLVADDLEGTQQELHELYYALHREE